MCEFVSWIEKDGQVLFLTSKDVNSSYGRKELEGCLDNDFIGHGAIRRFYSFQGGVDKENRNFWNGELPPEVKAAWNSGELDGMLKYLQTDDLEHIINNAPVEVTAWVIKQKYTDYEAMKKDNDWQIRLFGLVATQDYKTMKKDIEWYIRLVGLAATQDFETMKKDDEEYIRLFGLAATADAISRPVL